MASSRPFNKIITCGWRVERTRWEKGLIRSRTQCLRQSRTQCLRDEGLRTV